MADTKQYNVIYDISANVTKVKEGLNTVEQFANSLNGSLQNATKTVARFNDLLQSLSKFKPVPIDLDIKPFQAKIKIMEAEFSQAAARMQQAMRDIFNPGATNSVKTGYLKSQLESIRKERAAVQNELNQLAGREHKNGKVTVPAMSTKKKSSGSFKYHEGSQYDQMIKAGKQEEYDRTIRIRDEYIEKLNKQEAEISAALSGMSGRSAKSTAGPSVANPKVAKGLTEELKKTMDKITDTLPKVPLQFSFDQQKLKDLLKTELETPHYVTITPRFDEGALDRMRARLRNLGVEAVNTATGSTSGSKTYSRSFLNNSERELVESLRKPLSNAESAKLQAMKEDQLLKDLEKAKQKIATARAKVAEDPSARNQGALSKAVSNYKTLMASDDMRNLLRQIEELERRNFRASTKSVLNDREATQGARWQRVYDKAKVTFDNTRLPQEVRDAAERTMGQAEKEMSKLRMKRSNVGPGFTEAPVSISVGLNPDIAMADLARLKAFIENYKVALNIKAVNETVQIKDAVKKVVEKGKNKTTTATGPHIPIPVVLDTSKLEGDVNRALGEIEKKKATIQATIKFVDINSQVSKAIRDAHATIEKELLKRANKYAEIINNGGTLPVQKKAKQTVEDLKTSLKETIAKIPKSLTDVWVKVNMMFNELSITNAISNLQTTLDAKPLTVWVRLLPEESKGLVQQQQVQQQQQLQQQANNASKKKKPATTAPAATQRVTELKNTLSEQLKSTATKLAEGEPIEVQLHTEKALEKLNVLKGEIAQISLVNIDVVLNSKNLSKDILAVQDMLKAREVFVRLTLETSHTLDKLNIIIDQIKAREAFLKVSLDTSNVDGQLTTLIEKIRTAIASQQLNLNVQPTQKGASENKAPASAPASTGTTSNQTTTATVSAQNVKNAAETAAGTATPQTSVVKKPPLTKRVIKPLTAEEIGEPIYTPRTQEDALRHLFSLRSGQMRGQASDANVAVSNPNQNGALKFGKLENRLLKYAQGRGSTYLKMLVDNHLLLNTAFSSLVQEGTIPSDISALTPAHKAEILKRTMSYIDRNNGKVPLAMYNDYNSFSKLASPNPTISEAEAQRKARVQSSIESKRQQILKTRHDYIKWAQSLVGDNGKLMDFIKDNQRSFMAASKNLKFTPEKETSAERKVQYLDEVIKQLKRNGVTPSSELKALHKEQSAIVEANQLKALQTQALEGRKAAAIALRGPERIAFKSLGYPDRLNFLNSLMVEYGKRGLSTTRLSQFYEKTQKEYALQQKAEAEQKELERRTRVQNSIASKRTIADKMREEFYKRINPFVKDNGVLAKDIRKNRHFFTNAARATGFDFKNTAPQTPIQVIQYLDEVMRLMRGSGVKTPTSIQSIYDQTKTIIDAEKAKILQQNLQNERDNAVNAVRSTTSQKGMLGMNLDDKMKFLREVMKEYHKRGLPTTKLAKYYTQLNKTKAKQATVSSPVALTAEQAAYIAYQQTGIDPRTLDLSKPITVNPNSPKKPTITALGEDRALRAVKYYDALEKAFADNNGTMPKELAAQKKAAETELKKWTTKRSNIIKNMISPYVSSAEMRNLVADNWKSFYKAAIENHIKSIEQFNGLNSTAKLKFLQDAREHIARGGNKEVPYQLDKEISKLKTQIYGTAADPSKPSSGRGGSGSRGGGGGIYTGSKSGYERSFYDNTRKWAYPFSGQTSFGVRTPMMVDMAKGMGVMFAIGGAMSAIGESFSQAMQYQNTMETTKAILQHGTSTFGTTNYRHMEGIIRNVGIRTKFSAPEVASAAKFLAMAGYNIEDINNAIRPVADLALIGDTDLGETADKMTNIMTTFGISSDRMREIANILTTTATRSNTDLMMLAEAAKYGGGVAHMYGKNDPHLFADTMALFGVMGNAGIQGSSAGTGLRMMYQNIFNPNKKQKAVLNALEKRGVKTKNADGSFRSMAEFIRDVANTITDPNEMAAVVSTLFRITAQPAANAALMAAVGGDADSYNDTVKRFNKMEEDLKKRGGMAKLAELMEANHNAIYGNISSDVAEKKQNTFQGLLAQVTSTFTEGIVKAFESRSGGFEGMLISVRDYLAKPETVAMLRDILDLVADIAKIMGKFVTIWVDFYHTFPNAIKLWMTLQMVFTQFGYLLSPFVALLGVVNRVTGVVAKIAGGSGLALRLGGTATGSGLTNSALLASGTALFALPKKRAVTTPILGVPSVPLGAPLVSRGRPVSVLSEDLYSYARQGINQGGRATPSIQTQVSNASALLYGQMAANGWAYAEASEHNRKVEARANKMYGLPRAKRNLLRYWQVESVLTSVSAAGPGLKSGISKLLLGVVNSLAWVLGLLINPFTIAAAAITGITYGVYKANKLFTGQTEAQLRALENTEKLADQAHFEREKHAQWIHDFMNDPESEFFKKYGNGLNGSVTLSKKGEATLRYEAMMEARKKNYPELYDDLTKDFSHQRTALAAEKWMNSMLDNDVSRLALGDKYQTQVKDIYNLKSVLDNIGSNGYDSRTLAADVVYESLVKEKRNAQQVQRQQVLDMLHVEGAYDPKVKEAISEAENIVNKYLNKQLKEEEYQKQMAELRKKYIPDDLSKLNLVDANTLTNQQILDYADYSQLLQYKEGYVNFLNAALDPEHPGSPFAYANAVRQLVSGTIQEGTAKWQKYIADVLNNSSLTTTIHNANGDIKTWEIKLRALPNGKIDVDAIIRQVQETINGYKKNFADIAAISAGTYKMLADAGFIKDATPEGMRQYISDQLINDSGQKIISQTMASDYFDKYLAKDSYWKGSKQDFINWIFGTDKQRSTAHYSQKTGKLLDRMRTMRKIRNVYIDDKITDVMGANFLKENSEQKTEDNNPDPNKDLLSNTDLSGYASNYTSSNKVHTTQIAFNAPLVQFSDTQISSSAEENDIMMAVEQRVANVVLMAVTEAINQGTMEYYA